MGFQSHSFYLVLGSHFKWLLRAGDTTELDRDQAETNPSNQPNQPAATCGELVTAREPRADTVTVCPISDWIQGWCLGTLMA